MFIFIKEILILQINFIRKIVIIGLASSLFIQAQDLKAYDAESIADIFYQLNGDSKDPHKKINHTKGFCAVGEFVPAKNITKVVDIPLLTQKSIPTQIRYSLGGGNAHASDKSKPRGLALKMEGQKDSWELVMLNAEINFAKNPQEFAQYFTIRVPKNGKVDTANIAKVTNEVESFRNFDKYMQNIGITKSVGNTMYHSIHTFFIKDSQSKKFLPARWKIVPVDGVANLTKEELGKTSDNFLESDFKNKTAKKPIAYKMILVFANPNDVIDNTTALWSGKHRELEIGTLKAVSYNGKDCNGDVFMPNILPSGVEAPKDPLFELRNDTYTITFGRRQ